MVTRSSAGGAGLGNVDGGQMKPQRCVGVGPAAGQS